MEDCPNYREKLHKNLGNPQKYTDFVAADYERLKGRLPEPILKYFMDYGLSNFRRQSVWLCDPDSMLFAKQSWLSEFENAEIFMRTAFGDFFFWDGTYCWSCLVHLSHISYAAMNITWFLGESLSFKPYKKSLGITGFTDRGRIACGPLEPDEVYIWVPALALGGNSDTSRIEKGKMAVALDILSQLQPITIKRISV